MSAARAELEAELAEVRRAIASANPPRLLPVLLAQWMPRPNDRQAVLHLPDWAPCPEVGEVVETVDRSGWRAPFRILGTPGLLGFAAGGRVIATLAKPLPASLVRLRKREAELVASLTVGVEVWRGGLGRPAWRSELITSAST